MRLRLSAEPSPKVVRDRVGYSIQCLLQLIAEQMTKYNSQPTDQPNPIFPVAIFWNPKFMILSKPLNFDHIQGMWVSMLDLNCWNWEAANYTLAKLTVRWILAGNERQCWLKIGKFDWSCKYDFGRGWHYQEFRCQFRSGSFPSWFKQHFLYFFPLPQGQGSFLPTFCLRSILLGVFGKTGVSGSVWVVLDFPVNFSKANLMSPAGSSSNSLTRFWCSSRSTFSSIFHWSYSGNRSSMMRQVSTRLFLSPRLSKSSSWPIRSFRAASIPSVANCDKRAVASMI